MALESNIILDKKILMVVLHNVACCHQKVKDFNSCLTYIDAILFHFDCIIENNDANIINCVEVELQQLKQGSFITDYKIINKQVASISFEIITIENNTYSIQFSTSSGGYRVSNLKNHEEVVFESFEQMLPKISDGYISKFSSSLFQGLEKLAQNNQEDKELD